MTTPTADLGAPRPVDHVLDRLRLDLGQPDDGDERDDQQRERGQRLAVARAARRAPRRRRRSSRGGGPSGRTRTARRAPPRRSPRTSSCDDVNSGPGALVVNVGSTRHITASVDTVASIVAVPSALNDAVWSRSAPTSTRQPEDPVGGDHRGREHRVARQRLVALAVADHQRHDQADLDHGDRDGQHQRAERLADPVRHDLGEVHRRRAPTWRGRCRRRPARASAASTPTSARARSAPPRLSRSGGSSRLGVASRPWETERAIRRGPSHGRSW